MDAIKLVNVTKDYGDFVLRNIDLTLPSGCILGLVGENGAGKSTVVKLITTAIKPTSGEIEVLGKKTDSSDFASVKEHLGVVLDKTGLYGVLTPKQVGVIFSGLYENWDNGVYSDYLKRFGIPEKKNIASLSAGTVMKLAIATALSHDARLLILDEPTNGLDPVVRDEIVSIFGEFTRDERNSVLITSHIVSDLEKICDYIAILSKGELRLVGEKDALCEKYCIVKCTDEAFADIDPEAVVGVKKEKYGVRFMAERDKLPADTEAEKIGIEDMMIFLHSSTKEGTK